MPPLYPSVPKIVLVDDEPEILLGASLTLRQAGLHQVVTVQDSRTLLPFLAENEVGVVVLDLQMPHLSGRSLLADITASFPYVPIIIVTGANELETAVECMKMGAFDYLVKPIGSDRFVIGVRKALEIYSLRREIDSLRDSLLAGRVRREEAFTAIHTRSPRMKAIFGYLEAIAPTDQPVLIMGETGVGKELVARALHNLSGRTGQFVAVNSAGLDDQLFTDTLFGHRKGAFTGADRVREGLIARAAGGTLFLDEIGELSPGSQAKLLRLLQDGEYLPLGSDSPQTSDARIIAATNRDIDAGMADGVFRRDLYYRFCAHRVRIPPLRERAEDIPLLVEVFLGEAADDLRKAKPSYPPELLSALSRYSFPGNVRELRAMIYDAVTRHDGGGLPLASFHEAMGVGSSANGVRDTAGSEASGGADGRFPTLKEMEEAHVAAALQRACGNQRNAAALLGISRQALNQRLNKK